MESKKSKLKETEIILMVARGRGQGLGKWMKVIKRYKHLLKR